MGMRVWAFGGVVAMFVLLVVASLLFMSYGVRSIDSPQLQFVSGTEYNIGEAGQVIVEARYGNGTSALVNPCLMTVWYPDKSVFISQNSSLAASGNHYVNFTAPNVTGIYEYQAECGAIGIVSKSFHVSEFQNEMTQDLRRVRAEVTK